jgi:hypothetical protein
MALCVAALGWLAGVARADGDPASDVLASQPLFLAQDAGVTVIQQAQLAADLRAAQRDGYPLRVAIIGSSADLGSVTELWRQPQNYARFLGLELALIQNGPLLVVMPDGFGTHHLGLSAGAQQAALAGVRAGGLGASALVAIQHLAAAAGHPLPAAVVAAPSSPEQSDTISWIVFVVGGGIIAAAWATSLRARPIRLGKPGTPSRSC